MGGGRGSQRMGRSESLQGIRSQVDWDGALLFTVDLSPQEQATEDTKGKSLAKVAEAAVAQVNDPKYQAMLAENEASGTFAVPNVIALSCAKRTSLATGDS